MKKLDDEWIDLKYQKGCYVMMEKNISLKIARDCGLPCVALYNFILMHKYNNNPHGCYPSYDIIMKECNISKATLLSYLSKLEEHGYIKIKSGNRSGANLYYFPLADSNISNYEEDDYDYINNIKRKKYVKSKKESQEYNFDKQNENEIF